MTLVGLRLGDAGGEADRPSLCGAEARALIGEGIGLGVRVGLGLRLRLRARDCIGYTTPALAIPLVDPCGRTGGLARGLVVRGLRL